MPEVDEAIIKKFLLQLKQQKLVKDKPTNAFRKTEQLLYKYNDFGEAIRNKEIEIDELKDYGLKKRSKSIIKFGPDSGEVKTETERLEEKIAIMENAIEDTKQYIQIIDNALDKLADDKFYDIIPMKYFKGLTHEEISFELGVDAATITRHKNRLIKRLSIYLFPDEALNEMMA